MLGPMPSSKGVHVKRACSVSAAKIAAGQVQSRKLTIDENCVVTLETTDEEAYED